LSPYDIKKRKLTPTASSNSVNEPDFDDELTF